MTMIVMRRRHAVLLGCLLATLALAQEEDASPPKKILSKTHDTFKGHADIMEELQEEGSVKKPERPLKKDSEDVESFTCTLTGASGQEQCDAATDDDGSKCVWCVLNNFGFCVSGTQAAQFEQIIPTIDCDDQGGSDDDDKAATDDDKAPPDTDDAMWNCLESKDEASCGDKCVWCKTKGGFGVCLSPDAADDASDSYWFDCPADEDDQDDDDEEEWEELEEFEDKLEHLEVEDRYYPQEEEEGGEGEDDEYDDDEAEAEEGASQSQSQEEDEEDYDDDEEEEGEMEDWTEGDEEDEEDYEEEEGVEDEEPDMHEFVVDTSCVLAGMLLDPADEDATSEAACFQARDGAGNPCEWCAVAGSPFRLCLSEPQAQVAEYVGAVCTGSDESFEPEDFDDSCITHMVNDRNLSKEGCWKHMDLDGNGCEWCNLMGVEMCLGGVQAELVEHWGATCVLDDAEYTMAQTAIQQHLEFIKEQKDRERIARQAQRIAAMGEANPETPYEDEEEEEELDLQTLWLSSDPSCMVTTLRTSNGQDDELACAQTQDAQGNACNWCQLGTSFYMCLNDEQADVAEYMGIECETISADTQDILKEHAQRAEEYEDSDDEGGEGTSEEEGGPMDDAQDFDPSCILAMKNGPDQTTCVNTKDQDGQACEWCSWNDQISLCLASEQAQMVEPFGIKCDQVILRQPDTDLPKSAILAELSAQIDTSCLIDAGLANDPAKCTSAKDAITGKPCEWCSLGSLGVHACMSAEQAEQARPLGVTCQEGGSSSSGEEASSGEEGILQGIPKDFWSCISQSQSVDNCDETCTWCDLNGSKSGAGLCLSDAVADAIANTWPDGMLECTEPEAIVDIVDDPREGDNEEEEEEGDKEEEGDEDDDEEGDDDDDADDEYEGDEEGVEDVA